jgi:hypothetical protein
VVVCGRKVVFLVSFDPNCNRKASQSRDFFVATGAVGELVQTLLSKQGCPTYRGFCGLVHRVNQLDRPVGVCRSCRAHQLHDVVERHAFDRSAMDAVNHHPDDYALPVSRAAFLDRCGTDPGVWSLFIILEESAPEGFLRADTVGLVRHLRNGAGVSSVDESVNRQVAHQLRKSSAWLVLCSRRPSTMPTSSLFIASLPTSSGIHLAWGLRFFSRCRRLDCTSRYRGSCCRSSRNEARPSSPVDEPRTY